MKTNLHNLVASFEKPTYACSKAPLCLVSERSPVRCSPIRRTCSFVSRPQSKKK